MSKNRDNALYQLPQETEAEMASEGRRSISHTLLGSTHVVERKKQDGAEGEVGLCLKAVSQMTQQILQGALDLG